MLSIPTRTRGALAALAACTVLAAPSAAQGIVSGATLDSAQEVPPNGSTATGQASFFIDRANDRLYYFINFSGLAGSETVAHIHGFAPPGSNGPIITPLPLGSPKIGFFTYAPGDEQMYLDGLAYVNIHSSMFGAGEIRGQIVVDNTPNEVLFASLDGAQEVPPNGSTATGVGVFSIDTVTNNVDYYIEYSGLSSAETNAHLHGFAPPGSNGGILTPLPGGSPKAGTWTYSEPDEASVLAGLVYVNIHSTMFGGGEIRGQVEVVDNTITYCSGKVNSLGCAPFLTFVGQPSATSTVPFNITGNDFIPSESGFLLYSVIGKANVNFHGGKLCVKAPFTRFLPPKTAKNTGGAPCTGILRRNFNSRIQSGVDPALSTGQVVRAQFFQRDPADTFGFGDALSDGIQFVIEP